MAHLFEVWCISPFYFFSEVFPFGWKRTSDWLFKGGTKKPYIVWNQNKQTNNKYRILHFYCFLCIISCTEVNWEIVLKKSTWRTVSHNGTVITHLIHKQVRKKKRATFLFVWSVSLWLQKCLSRPNVLNQYKLLVYQCVAWPRRGTWYSVILNDYRE